MLHAAILALGGGLQRTKEITINGILSELTHTIDYIIRESAHQDYRVMIKSRLTFKAISEIYLRQCRKTLVKAKKGVNKNTIQEVKDILAKQTEMTA